MSIKASELILHSDGKIYHINCGPGEIADTIITVGDPERVERVSKYFDKIEFKSVYREFVTHTGYIGKKRITVISTGIGPDNIDIVINEIDALFNIDLSKRTIKDDKTKLKFIRIGTSGALQDDIPVDSFVKSKGAFGLDNLMHFYTYRSSPEIKALLKSFIDFMSFNRIQPYAFMSSEMLFNNIGPEWKDGFTITCPGFYAPQGRSLRLRPSEVDFLAKAKKWSFGPHRATNFEMETSAIYGLSSILGHEALSLSAIIANRPKGTFSRDPYKTVESLIQGTLAAIEQL